MAEPGDALRRTSLYETHVAAGAKMVPFAGFEMPVQYTGVIEEHHAVRQAAGLFDVSHMGEFEARGPGAAGLLRRLVTNDVSRLEVGRVMYCTMCREDGGIIDDLTVYRLADERYMAVVNASNIGMDWAWMAARKGAGVEFRDVSSEAGPLAVAGPPRRGRPGRAPPRRGGL